MSNTFGTRDIVEVFVACDCFPVRAGWTISGWLAEDRWIEGIPIPDFATIFGLRPERKLSLPHPILGNAFAPLRRLPLYASSAMQVLT